MCFTSIDKFAGNEKGHPKTALYDFCPVACRHFHSCICQNGGCHNPALRFTGAANPMWEPVTCYLGNAWAPQRLARRTLTKKAKTIDPDGARVIRLSAVELYPLAHFSFADCGIGDLPKLALLINECRVSALFCAAKVATGLARVLLYTFLVTNGPSHVISLAFVLGRKNRSRRKNNGQDANCSFYVLISHMCLLDYKGFSLPCAQARLCQKRAQESIGRWFAPLFPVISEFLRELAAPVIPNRESHSSAWAMPARVLFSRMPSDPFVKETKQKGFLRKIQFNPRPRLRVAAACAEIHLHNSCLPPSQKSRAQKALPVKNGAVTLTAL